MIQADEEKRKLIFSEKEAEWSKFSAQVKVGDIFDGRVGSVEDYGAFVHLRFPDGTFSPNRVLLDLRCIRNLLISIKRP